MNKNTYTLTALVLLSIGLSACNQPVKDPASKSNSDLEMQKSVTPIEFSEVMSNPVDISAEDLATLMEVPKEVLEAVPTEAEAAEILEQYNALTPEERENIDLIGDLLQNAPVITKQDLEQRVALSQEFEARDLDIEDSYQRMDNLCGFTDIQADDFDKSLSYFYKRGEVDLDAILNLTSNKEDWSEAEEIQVLQIITRTSLSSKAELQAACRDIFSDLKATNYGENVPEPAVEEKEFVMPDSPIERMVLTEQLKVDPAAIVIEGRDLQGNIVEDLIDPIEAEYIDPTPTAFSPEVFPQQDLPTPEELGIDPEIAEEVIITAGTQAKEEALKIGGGAAIFDEAEMLERNNAIGEFMANTPAMVNITFTEVINELCEVELEPVPAGLFISRVFVERDNSFEEAMNTYQNQALSQTEKRNRILASVVDRAGRNTLEANVKLCQEIIAGLPEIE